VRRIIRNGFRLERELVLSSSFWHNSRLCAAGRKGLREGAPRSKSISSLAQGAAYLAVGGTLVNRGLVPTPAGYTLGT
jgi:hypothetical protein